MASRRWTHGARTFAIGRHPARAAHDDVDLVVEVRTGSYAQAAEVLQRLAYVQHESLDRYAPFHRFTRGREHVDLMGPEGKPGRFLGREVLAVPGSRSALNRTITYQTAGGVAIRIPDMESALSLKGAAFRLPGHNKVRHLQDAVTLFACLDTAQPDISKSMKKNINNLISAMDNPEAGSFADPTNRRQAIRAIRAVQPACAKLVGQRVIRHVGTDHRREQFW